MLQSTTKSLLEGRVILASGSPRRREILENLGLKIEIIPSTFDEKLNRSNYKNHGDFVADLAAHKVQDVFKRLKENSDSAVSLIIGADTIVTKGNEIYGKPTDKKDAFTTLSFLAGKTHTVFTGVCLKTLEKEVKFWNSTEVTFGNISMDQINAYVETGEPLDKAGGYGIQGVGGCFVEKINGDFYTVVGLPLYSTIKHLNNLFCEV
ncbi:dTTP/UTP pyrophosphatase [Phymastichus coffea]|uniref:dTTP/UTP pyrophosphatase n=1 Tax=Phymastichus coffea TaxID=108790 RepID=UPI00273C6439|nr:dTTP/UTP pyrophosphatase [Phymastichus coffea]